MINEKGWQEVNEMLAIHWLRTAARLFCSFRVSSLHSLYKRTNIHTLMNDGPERRLSNKKLLFHGFEKLWIS